MQGSINLLLLFFLWLQSGEKTVAIVVVAVGDVQHVQFGHLEERATTVVVVVSTF